MKQLLSVLLLAGMLQSIDGRFEFNQNHHWIPSRDLPMTGRVSDPNVEPDWEEEMDFEEWYRYWHSG